MCVKDDGKIAKEACWLKWSLEIVGCWEDNSWCIVKMVGGDQSGSHLA